MIFEYNLMKTLSVIAGFVIGGLITLPLPILAIKYDNDIAAGIYLGALLLIIAILAGFSDN